MPAARFAAPRQGLAFGAMLASGFAGLGYQIVWTQQASVWLGHEVAAVLAVVTAFFGGLAAGALVLGPRIACSPRPGRWVAACEGVIALWSLLLAALLPALSAWLLDLTGEQPDVLWQGTVAFAGTFVILLPATAAMGATLPAMERLLAGSGHDGAALARLYAANTAGAVLGVLAAAFWLVPGFGLVRTAALCAVLNLMAAAAALGLQAQVGAQAVAPGPRAPKDGARLLGVLAATGLLGIGYEVVVVRVISQVAEDTVYTFALLLAVYLAFTALGAAAWARHVRRRVGPDDVDAGGKLPEALALACLLGACSLWAAEDLRAGAAQALGGGMAAALAAEAALAGLAFAAPTFVMGALFSHLGAQAQRSGIGFGRALGVNTLGAAAAPLLFGVVLVPAFGPKAALLCVAAGYLALGPLVRRAQRPWRWRGPAALGAGLAGLALWAPPLRFVEVPEGGQVLSYREGALAAVSVVEDGAGVKRLRIDNRQQEGSSATGLADARQALLPLLLHPAPARALFLGLGTGVTARAAAAEPGLQVDAVELLPEVIAASAEFMVDGDGPPASLRLLAADARRYVRATAARYDLIVSDNFHPARSGSGALYTVEHFQAVQRRLNAGGVFCQWLPLHQLDLPTLRSIVRSFMAVYPEGAALLATNSLDTPVIGLVARAGGGRFELQPLRQRLAAAGVARPLAAFGLSDEWSLLGSFVAGPRALHGLAGDAPLNTDDHPVVAYRAPRVTYAPASLPRDRLVDLLGRVEVEPGEVVDDGGEAGWAQRLAAYGAARRLFIAAGRGVHPTGDPGAMLAQVREPLLAVLRASPEFRPAYDPLLRLAAALAPRDAAGARQLLAELAHAQPARPEAPQVLRQLGGAAP